MSRPPRFQPELVRELAQAVVSSAVSTAHHMPFGWGNENWVVESGGARFVVKLGPPESGSRWAATHSVYDLACRVGLPVPRLMWFDPASPLAGGWTARIFTWMDGVRPETVLHGASVARFFGELADATRTLHSLPTEKFTSRLDGSAPAFSRWSEYIEYRLPRAVGRVRETTAFAEAEAATIATAIRSLAHAVDPDARPAICHRDLYLDNLLATPEGSLAAILDFDAAEAWDPAIDLVKLRWRVFPDYPDAEAHFVGRYGEQPRWTERLRLAELLELLNAVPNAIAAGDPDFERSARGRLSEVLEP